MSDPALAQIDGWLPQVARERHRTATEILVQHLPTRRLFAAALGPDRVQTILADVRAPEVWENEGGAIRA